MKNVMLQMNMCEVWTPDRHSRSRTASELSRTDVNNNAVCDMSMDESTPGRHSIDRCSSNERYYSRRKRYALEDLSELMCAMKIARGTDADLDSDGKDRLPPKTSRKHVGNRSKITLKVGWRRRRSHASHCSSPCPPPPPSPWLLSSSSGGGGGVGGGGGGDGVEESEDSTSDGGCGGVERAAAAGRRPRPRQRRHAPQPPHQQHQQPRRPRRHQRGPCPACRATRSASPSPATSVRAEAGSPVLRTPVLATRRAASCHGSPEHSSPSPGPSTAAALHALALRKRSSRTPRTPRTPRVPPAPPPLPLPLPLPHFASDEWVAARHLQARRRRRDWERCLQQREQVSRWRSGGCVGVRRSGEALGICSGGGGSSGGGRRGGVGGSGSASDDLEQLGSALGRLQLRGRRRWRTRPRTPRVVPTAHAGDVVFNVSVPESARPLVAR